MIEFFSLSCFTKKSRYNYNKNHKLLQQKTCVYSNEKVFNYILFICLIVNKEHQLFEQKTLTTK
jgi:hypothetical protein